MAGGPELLKLVDMIHRDKDIDPERLFESLEVALQAAVRKRYGKPEEPDEPEEGDEGVFVRIDRASGNIEAFCDGYPIAADELGRIAAQTAKQVIIQKIREAEQDVVYAEFETRSRELINGAIHRFEKGDIVVTLGRGEGVLPRTEQVRGENYHIGDRVRALILDVRRIGARVRVVLSRTHPDLIRRLFELEVPEIADGIIEIKDLAREPGYRTKIAVTSYDPKIDCVGACVGVRGSRIRNIIDELNGEKIDIIRWNDSPEMLIMNALKPAEIESITLDDETAEAEVMVAEDQLSLAIGRKGQNVRLAAKLTGWSIEIVRSSEAGGEGSSQELDAEAVAFLEMTEGGETPSDEDGETPSDESGEPKTETVAEENVSEAESESLESGAESTVSTSEETSAPTAGGTDQPEANPLG